jgi:hypothetical protein
MVDEDFWCYVIDVGEANPFVTIAGGGPAAGSEGAKETLIYSILSFSR